MSSIALGPNNTYALIGEQGNHVIRRINLANNEVKTIAGTAGLGGKTDGFGSAALFNGLGGMALTADDSTLLLVDRDSFTIRQLTLTR